MNAKKLILAAILGLLGLSGEARAPLVKYGVEWGYAPTVYYKQALNYISEDGYRVDDRTGGLTWSSNGFILAGVGLNVSEHFCLSAHSGYMGISGGNRVIPVLLRATGYVAGSEKDGITVFLDFGAGLHIPKEDQPDRKPCLTGDAGLGYHLVLERRAGLNLMFSVKGTYDRPLVPDAKEVRRSAAFYLAPVVSVGLDF